MSRRAQAVPLLALLAAGCGYHVVSPEVGGGRTLAVPTTQNDTRWRGIEASLTGDLRRDAQRQLDVVLTDTTADLRLETAIKEVERQAPVRSSSGGAALGAVTMELSWRLLSRSGQEVLSGSTQRTLEFRPEQGETAYTALDELLDSMAEHVVIEVSSGLSAGPPQT